MYQKGPVFDPKSADHIVLNQTVGTLQFANTVRADASL